MPQWQVWYTDASGSTRLAVPIAADPETARRQADALAARPGMLSVQLMTPAGVIHEVLRSPEVSPSA